MKFAIDTNVLAYAEGMNGPEKKQFALQLLQRMPFELTGVPAQALGELFSVLVRKMGRSAAEARAAVLRWGDVFPLLETSGTVLVAAADIAVDHRLVFWDAVMIAAAADAGCRFLLSEDLQEGFTWGGVTVVNPFREGGHALLDAFFDDFA